MAILFSQEDGSDQHYDTYDEFEQAFILLKRLNGEKVPQDLLDEVKAKYGDNETKPIQLEIDVTEIESAISEAVRELEEELDEINGEGEDELLPVGTKVRMLNHSSCGDLNPGDEGTITDTDTRRFMGVRIVRVCSGEDGYDWAGRDDVEVVEEDSPTEFENDDLVRVTESFRDSFGDVAKINSILPVRIDGDDRVLGVGTVLIGDNHDKLRLVCRREDRKDIEL